MSLRPELINSLGDELFQALRQRSSLKPLTARHPDLTIEEAYRISLRMLERRKVEGERVVGKKIGVTSKPVQEMLGVHQPDFGFLTNVMHMVNGASVSLAEHKLIQPKAEGEIAFRLKQDLKGPGISAEDVLDATEYVSACFEIVDSRIDNWQIKIQDTVADNASCGVFVVGDEQVEPRSLDLAAARMTVQCNGKPVAEGLGSAVQGHPAQAVAWLANTLGEFGIPFLAGELILSGSLAPLLPIVAGDAYTMQIEGIGSAAIRFVE